MNRTCAHCGRWTRLRDRGHLPAELTDWRLRGNCSLPVASMPIPAPDKTSEQWAVEAGLPYGKTKRKDDGCGQWQAKEGAA